jgi:hypothetical protein
VAVSLLGCLLGGRKNLLLVDSEFGNLLIQIAIIKPSFCDLLCWFKIPTTTYIFAQHGGQ